MTNNRRRPRPDPAGHQIFQQPLDHHRVLAGALAESQNMLISLGIHAHGGQHVMAAKTQAIEVDKQNVPVVKTTLG